MLLALRENDPLAKVAEAGNVPVVHGGRPRKGARAGTSTPTTGVAPARPSNT